MVKTIIILLVFIAQITEPYTVYDDIDYSNVDVEEELRKWISELSETYFGRYFRDAIDFLRKAPNWTNKFKTEGNTLNIITVSVVSHFNTKINILNLGRNF